MASIKPSAGSETSFSTDLLPCAAIAALGFEDIPRAECLFNLDPNAFEYSYDVEVEVSAPKLELSRVEARLARLATRYSVPESELDKLHKDMSDAFAGFRTKVSKPSEMLQELRQEVKARAGRDLPMVSILCDSHFTFSRGLFFATGRNSVSLRV